MFYKYFIGVSIGQQIERSVKMSIYDFVVKDGEGKDVPLKNFEGKVLLIVNTATECGFTPQYENLQKLYENYKDTGLEILDFPCNQFGGQAPGTNEEIKSFCALNFGVQYPQFQKIEVNGEGAIPLYKFLKEKQGFKGFDKEHELISVLEDMFEKEDPDFRSKPDIKWNFTKFLVDRKGNVVSRFEPTKDMKVVEEEIKKLL